MQSFNGRRALIALVMRLVFILLLSAVFLMPRGAQAQVAWQLNAGPSVEDAGALRRALALEMRDLDLVAEHDCEGQSPKTPEIFIAVRVLKPNAVAALELRVWERGLEVGTRQVALSGGPRLVARRVALAVAELVRNLNARRKRAERIRIQRLKQEEEAQAQAKERERRQQLQLAASAEATAYLKGNWSAGPVLGLSIFQHAPFEIALQFSWQAGRVTQLTSASLGQTAPTLTMSEARFGLGYHFFRRGRWSTKAITMMTYSVAQMGSGVQTDGQRSRATWTSRAWAEAALGYEISPQLRAELSFLAGGLLRPVQLSLNQVEENWSGAFLGSSLRFYFGI